MLIFLVDILRSHFFLIIFAPVIRTFISYDFMCTSPLHIDLGTRIRFFNPAGSVPTAVTVPCGVCPDCVSSLRNSYYLRCVSEYQDCVSHGGCVVFLTFTYSDDNVPFVNYSLNSFTHDIDFEFCRGFIPDADGECYSMFTFCKRDLQVFFNSLRKYFERSGFVNCFRYFVCGEYGMDERFTQRPHYHALFFLDSRISSHYGGFDNIGSSRFLTLVNRLWRFGRVSESKEYGLKVSSATTAGYVSKYVGKPLDILDLRRFSLFRSFITRNFDSLYPEDFKYNRSIDSLLKYYFRVSCSRLFVLKSKCFGLSLVSDFDGLSPLGCACKLKLGVPVVGDSNTFFYSYPRYVVNKLLYVTNSEGIRCLSSRGYHIKFYLFKDLINTLVDSVFHTDISVFRDWFFSSDIFESGADYNCFYDHYKDYDFVRAFFCYKLFVRGRCLSTNHARLASYDKYLSIYHTIDYDDFYHSLFRLNYGYQLVYDIDSCIYKYHSFSDFLDNHPDSFTSPIFFSEFERFDFIFSNFRNYLRSSISYTRLDHDKEIKRISDILNIFSYGIS